VSIIVCSLPNTNALYFGQALGNEIQDIMNESDTVMRGSSIGEEVGGVKDIADELSEHMRLFEVRVPAISENVGETCWCYETLDRVRLTFQLISVTHHLMFT